MYSVNLKTNGKAGCALGRGYAVIDKSLPRLRLPVWAGVHSDLVFSESGPPFCPKKWLQKCRMARFKSKVAMAKSPLPQLQNGSPQTRWATPHSLRPLLLQTAHVHNVLLVLFITSSSSLFSGFQRVDGLELCRKPLTQISVGLQETTQPLQLLSVLRLCIVVVIICSGMQ